MKRKSKSLLSALMGLLMVMLLALPVAAHTGDADISGHNGQASENISSSRPSDIQGHWAVQPIAVWLDKGFITSYEDGTFKPEASISRAEFIAVLNHSLGLSARTNIDYTDVPADAWYAEDLQKAQAAGYIAGYADGTFKPDASILRAEVAQIIAAVFKTNECEPDDKISTYKDSGDIPAWARSAFNYGLCQKIFAGYPDNTVRPLNQITRAEAVAVLYQAINSPGKTVPEQTFFTGYIEDEDCFVWHTDPANNSNPGNDSKDCLSMAGCASSGYGIAVPQGDGSYKFYYFDGSFAPNATGAQVQAAELIANTAKTDHIEITVTGTLTGDTKTAADGRNYPVIRVSSIFEGSNSLVGIQKFSGWLGDSDCSPKKSDPTAMSTECLKCTKCEASGYGISIKQADGTFKYYKFDENGHNLARQIVAATTQVKVPPIIAEGSLDGDILQVVSVIEVK